MGQFMADSTSRELTYGALRRQFFYPAMFATRRAPKMIGLLLPATRRALANLGVAVAVRFP
jgi:hypothetical protein